ncbi:MAG: hypothetical protein JWN44_964 [Myxococcales bacterium]|nr:hypothetical protein [Myxococcales bacterium]
MTRQLRPSPHCLNCGKEVQGRFCPECGQENTDYKVSIGRLLGDLFEELFQLESRLWRSLWDLVRHPGHLTREYNAGRRVRYTSPLRLYLLASVVYFFAIAVLPPRADDTTLRADFDQQEVNDMPPPTTAVGRRIRERLGLLGKLDKKETSRRAREMIVTYTPRVMAILVPLFALLVQMLFWRHLFVEHLVFALHSHALTFFLMALAAPARSGSLDALAILLGGVWTFIALHGVYEQSWLRVLWKTLILAFLYSMLVAVGIAGGMLAGLLLF